MLEKLSFLREKYNDLTQQVSNPDVIANHEKFTKLMQEQAQLQPIIDVYNKYETVDSQIKEAEELLQDPETDEDFKELCNDDLKELKPQLAELEDELKVLLLPKDPNDERGVIVEIRGGAGGDEAALFAGDLFRMFSRYAERNHWNTEILNSNVLGTGGFKEITFSISSKGAYSRLKFESGVHRVQRIPTTESGGRIHTSTATVAVLPEVDDVEVEIDPNDLRIDVYRSSGNGGQSVNTTDSAVRITHLPTGIVITCQDEKSQLKNKDKALKVLKARLYEIEEQKRQNEIASERKSQVGTGDRSERIRTYNFPQGRVTDHRIGMTIHSLDDFLDGNIDEIVDALITYDQTEKLKQM